MRRLNRWRRTAWWRDGGKVDNVGGGLGVAMVDQLVHHRDQLVQHLGKTEGTVGIGTLGHIIGLVGIQRLRLHWLAVKCLIAGLFKRLSQFHISVKMD